VTVYTEQMMLDQGWRRRYPTAAAPVEVLSARGAERDSRSQDTADLNDADAMKTDRARHQTEGEAFRQVQRCAEAPSSCQLSTASSAGWRSTTCGKPVQRRDGEVRPQQVPRGGAEPRHDFGGSSLPKVVQTTK
jgi:hypothetical protein